MPRLSFRSPPVHEVILTVQFGMRAELKALDMASQLLSADHGFLAPERVEAHQVELIGTPTGEAGARVRREVIGWAFKTSGPSGPTKVVQATRDSLAVHSIRSGVWPVGPYPGWEVNGPWAFSIFRELAQIYGALGPRRAALRYLNRIAIPDSTDLREWFRFVPPSPAGLSEPSVFQFGQTWDRVQDHGDLSATVRLVRIAIDDPSRQQGHQGVLLDIEVFTRRQAKAPSFDALPDWFGEAHEVENGIFDNSITQKLAETFGKS